MVVNWLRWGFVMPFAAQITCSFSLALGGPINATLLTFPSLITEGIEKVGSFCLQGIQRVCNPSSFISIWFHDHGPQ